MKGPNPASMKPRDPDFVELFTPKPVTILCDEYGLRDLQADAIAGLTLAIVALPFSMAIAIAASLSPDKGSFTAIMCHFSCWQPTTAGSRKFTGLVTEADSSLNSDRCFHSPFQDPGNNGQRDHAACPDGAKPSQPLPERH
jgi:hypothetical protein